MGKGLDAPKHNPADPQAWLAGSNHPYAPFPGNALKWESRVWDDGTTYGITCLHDEPAHAPIAVKQLLINPKLVNCERNAQMWRSSCGHCLTHTPPAQPAALYVIAGMRGWHERACPTARASWSLATARAADSSASIAATSACMTHMCSAHMQCTRVSPNRRGQEPIRAFHTAACKPDTEVLPAAGTRASLRTALRTGWACTRA